LDSQLDATLAPRILAHRRLPDLLVALRTDGFALYGPQVRDGAIVIDKLQDADALPRGWASEQEGGKYRLHRRKDEAVFGYVHGADSWKKLLHPAHMRLWSARREGGGFVVQPDDDPPEPFALIGVRGCELRAIAIQDRVFLEGEHVDAVYRARRTNAFIIGVDCGEPGGTCFCTSMGTGPSVGPGYDLALTELGAADGEALHRFVVRVGSARGQAIVDRMHLPEADAKEQRNAVAVTDAASAQMHRAMPPNAREVLLANRESPHWDEVAKRCLTCGNCTMVCPTCFCTTVEDTTDLTGDNAERWRLWDSCFTFEFSYVVGDTVRKSAPARYRHWITHKLATWHDQFGESGCVGCGRCITWCPVAIDITAEVAALAESGDKT
jgi:sulfhydrogenase subunit beta (sulfur reductase)